MANQSTSTRKKSGTSRAKRSASSRGKKATGTAKAKTSGMTSSMTGSPNFNLTKVRNQAQKINQWSADLLGELPPPMTRGGRGKGSSSASTNQ